MSEIFVSKIIALTPIKNRDFIQSATVMGENVIVSIDSKVGDVGLFIQPETRLSVAFCHHNNLHRHKELNKDTTKAGYLEDNRKVNAITLNKVQSGGLFVPMTSLDYLGEGSIKGLKVGDSFDKRCGEEICRKYISAQTAKAMKNKQGKGKKKAKWYELAGGSVQAPDFAEHMSTKHFKYSVDPTGSSYCGIANGCQITISNKVHGTSARYSNTKVVVKPGGIKGLINKYFPTFYKPTEEYQYLMGTRRVVKFKGKDDNGYHGSEEFRYAWLELLKPHLDRGLTVYGEIAGYAGESLIMATHKTSKIGDKKLRKKYGESMDYTYGCAKGKNRFHVYRITWTDPVTGKVAEFSQKHVDDWCEENGFLSGHHYESFVFDGDIKSLYDMVMEHTERKEFNGSDPIDPSHLTEGVVVRIDSPEPGIGVRFLKSKQFAFCEMESHASASGVVDTEDAEGIVEDSEEEAGEL